MNEPRSTLAGVACGQAFRQTCPMKPSRRDVTALGAAAVVVAATVWFISRIHAVSDKQDRALIAGIVQGELAPVAVALVLLPLLATWWVRGRPSLDAEDGPARHRSLRFAARHRAFVQAATRNIDLRGLVSPPEVPVEMDAVFIDVGVAPRPVRDVAPGVLYAEAAQEPNRRSVWEFIEQPRPAVLALVGGPGTGKSTLLRHIARTLAGSRRRRHRRRIPVLLELRRYAQDIVADRRAPLWRIWRLGLGDLAQQEPQSWLRRRLERGDCVVLLDGLDEVPSPTDDELIRDWIIDQITQYPDNDYLITSRPHDYATRPIRSATTLEARNLTDTQVQDFVSAMYQALPPGAGTAQAAAGDLLARLRTRPELAEFTANPLLLTMIVLAHRAGGSLPDSRAMLYADVCSGVLTRRSNSHRWGTDLPAETKQRVLAALAYAMMQARTNEQPAAQIVPVIRSALGGADQSTAQRFVTDVSANGLLVETRRGHYAFAHRSFQEYLAARHIAEHDLRPVLAGTIGDGWWRETQVLYASSAEADTVVRACLDDGGTDALSLAMECVSGSTGLDPVLRRRLADAMAGALQRDADPHHRGAIIRMLLQQGVGPLLPTADGHRVGARPVPQRIYRLFVEDTGRPPPDGGWDAPDSASTATGIWPDDAVAFVTWLNGLGGSTGIRYELSTAADVQALHAGFGGAALAHHSGEHRFWGTATADDTELQRWTIGGEPEPLRISTEQMRTRLTDDGELLNQLLSELTRLHARGLCRAIAGLDLPGEDDDRPNYSEEYLVPRGAARAYARCLTRTLKAHTAVSRDPDAERIQEALRRFQGSLTAADLALLEATLGSRPTTRTAFADLHDCLDDRLDFETASVVKRARDAFRSMRKAEGAAIRRAHAHGRSPGPRIGTDEQILDRFIDSGVFAGQWGSSRHIGGWGIERDCHRSVSSVLGDAASAVLAAALAITVNSAFEVFSPVEAFVAAALPLSRKPAALDLRSLAEALGTVRDQLECGDAPALRLLGLLLARTAEPIVTRSQRPTRTSAGLARLCALTVAVEAESRQMPQVAEACRTIAEGVTVLWTRTTGAAKSDVLLITAG
ncbi:NACHT domain-containing protein [Actinoplanes sp. NPDC049668]|uniref:NACHT domain-containing protein n=1 Tax=unclassified Actinoplanes TaxID=2626549 RepID=UPI0033A87EFC